MIFSFITPQNKPIFSPVTKSWIACFVASFLLISVFLGLIEIETNRFTTSSNSIQDQINEQQKIQEELEKKFLFLQTQTNEIQTIATQNTSLLKAIANLFDLIPNQITINTISLTDQNLTIKGITPSKEIYTFLLEAPLRAIFSESRVDFFVLPSGWYNFISVSKIKYNTLKDNINE